MSYTIVGQAFEQDRRVRDSFSASALHVEHHLLDTTDAIFGGTPYIETRLDKIVCAHFGAFDGGTPPSSLTIATMPAQVNDYELEGIRQVLVVGASGRVCVTVYGYKEGV